MSWPPKAACVQVRPAALRRRDRTADVSSGPRVTVRRHASNLPLGGPGGGSPPASRSGRAATGLVSDRKLTEFTPKQSDSPCSRPGPTDPVQSLRSGSLSAISSHSVWNESHPSEASRASMRASLHVLDRVLGRRTCRFRTQLVIAAAIHQHEPPGWPRPPICRSKMPWPAWIATFLSPKARASARRTRCLAPVSGRGSGLAGSRAKDAGILRNGVDMRLPEQPRSMRQMHGRGIPPPRRAWRGAARCATAGRPG